MGRQSGWCRVNDISLFVGVPRHLLLSVAYLYRLDDQTELFFDLVGSVTFIGLMVVAVWFAGDYDVRS